MQYGPHGVACAPRKPPLQPQHYALHCDQNVARPRFSEVPGRQKFSSSAQALYWNVLVGFAHAPTLPRCQESCTAGQLSACAFFKRVSSDFPGVSTFFQGFSPFGFFRVFHLEVFRSDCWTLYSALGKHNLVSKRPTMR
jgi:hypothetical protein